jgi:hypothetical protein
VTTVNLRFDSLFHRDASSAQSHLTKADSAASNGFCTRSRFSESFGPLHAGECADPFADLAVPILYNNIADSPTIEGSPET